MQGKTIFILVILIVVSSVFAFKFLGYEEIPAISNTKDSNRYIREEGCIVLTARELKEKMYSDDEVIPTSTKIQNAEFSMGFPQNWKVYEYNDLKSNNLDTISHDPPPEYKQIAQTFTVGVSGPNADIYMTCLRINLPYYGSGSGEICCDIRTLVGRDPIYFPSNTNLASSSVYDGGIKDNDDYWNFTFNPAVSLQAGGLYCFVLRVPGSSLCKSVQYGSDYYLGGYICRTNDNGKNWLYDEYSDVYDWEIYGYGIEKPEEKEVDKTPVSQLYHDLDDGDCIIVYDSISSINYYPDEDFTEICFSWYEHKNVMDSYCFFFEGDMSDSYGEGDVVEITLHLIHIQLETEKNKYEIEVFDEQWAGANYFKDNVEDKLIETGLKPISSDHIYCRRTR